MSETKTYRIRGMNGASCASIIEKTWKKTDGVYSAEVNYGTETAKIAFDETKTKPQHLSEKRGPLGYSIILSDSPTAEDMGLPAQAGMSADEHAVHLGLDQSKKEKLAEVSDMKTKVVSAIPLAVISIVIMIWDVLAKYKPATEMSPVTGEFVHHLLPLMATYVLFVVGKPYLLGFYRFFRYGKANMDTLIGIGTVAAYLYSFVVTAFEESLRPYLNVDATYYDVAIVVIAFITLGKYLETRSKVKTGDAIEKLLNLQAKTALVVRDGVEVE